MKAMQRDGACKSIWQQAMPEFIPAGNSSSGPLFDVIIVGGGVTGTTTAYLLQQAGKKCLLVEAHTLCFGTTGGTTAHLNNFFDTTYSQMESKFSQSAAGLLAEAANQALELYRNNIKSLAIECAYKVYDGYLYARDKKEEKELEKLAEAARRAGIDVRDVNHVPVPIPFVRAIAFKDQAQIHPVQYVYALAKAFEEKGGVIRQHTVYSTAQKENDGIRVKTNNGEFLTRKLIYATHTTPGLNILHFRMAPYRSYVVGVKLSDGNYPSSPAYDMGDPYHYYRTQVIDGEEYLIAGGEDHKTGHEKDTEIPFENLVRYLRQYYNFEDIAFRWSSQYYEPADGLAYIGEAPGNDPNVFVATGFSGNGMTYSHIAARVLTDLIINGSSPLEKLLSPSRIKPIAGFGNFANNAVDVASAFVGERLHTKKLDDPDELENGKGRVVKYDQHTAAVYKDENAAITAIDPVCTHAKCVVTWNTVEKSWDCPCHGARFSVNGKVLNGPADKDLRILEMQYSSRF